MKNRFKEKKSSDIAFDLFVVILCVLIFIAIAYPIYFIVIASVSDPSAIAAGQVKLLPKGFSLFGYKEILKDSRIWIGYLNTMIYSFGGTIVNLAVTLPVAYALSRKEFKARNILMFFFIFTMFFNGGLIPTYLLMKDVHLLDSRLAFILPSALNVYNLIIARTFFENSIPDGLYEAASLDGCSHFTFFVKIAIPISKAIISVIGLYYLVEHWNDFFTGLIYVRDYSKQPLQIVLRDILLSNQTFQGGAGTGGSSGGYAQRYADQIKYGVIIVSTLPMLVIYPFMQKYFEKGVMIGAVKG